jgi:hypothetical protein
MCVPDVSSGSSEAAMAEEVGQLGRAQPAGWGLSQGERQVSFKQSGGSRSTREAHQFYVIVPVNHLEGSTKPSGRLPRVKERSVACSVFPANCVGGVILLCDMIMLCKLTSVQLALFSACGGSG